MNASFPFNHQQKTCAACLENILTKECVQKSSKREMSTVDQNVLDQLVVMLTQEKTTYLPCFDYLSLHEEYQVTNGFVNESWRRKICEWCYEVADHYGFDREVVSIALHYLDRVIAHKTQTTKSSVPKKEFQLVAVTCLYLAIKLHGETDAAEGKPQKLRINAYVELSRGMFTIEDFEAVERSILSILEWHVNPPTTVAFVASLLRLLPQSWDEQLLHSDVASSVFEMARYLTELAVCVSSFSFQFQSSEISYAAILCAIDALREKVPIPDGAKSAFLHAMAEYTSLTPSSQNVRKACFMFMDLCPALFTQPQVPNRLAQSASITSASRASNGRVEQPPSLTRSNSSHASPELTNGVLSRSLSVSSAGNDSVRSSSPTGVNEVNADEATMHRSIK